MKDTKRGRGYNKYYNKYNYNRNYGYNRYNNYQYIKSINKVTPSTDPGFTGPKKDWFSDVEFFNQMQGTSDYDNKKDYYFHSYSTFYIHEDMLSDKVRTESYLNAINYNKEIFKDKVVLDIGCGTGVLSIFAAKAGAKKVYGIDFAEIADYAKKIVKDNNLEDKVIIMKTKVEDAEINEKVDIIISEWMGYFLLFESMLDTVLYARDKWLKEGGKILPDKAKIYLAAIEDYNYVKDKKTFWNDVYGVNMNCIAPIFYSEPSIFNYESKYVISNSCKIFEIDLNTVKVEDLDFASSYKLTFKRKDTFSGLVGWFDMEFSNIPKTLSFSTSPFTKSTHWKQCIFYSNKSVDVHKDNVLNGSIAVRKAKENPRALDIKISFHFSPTSRLTDAIFHYFLSIFFIIHILLLIHSFFSNSFFIYFFI